MSSDYACWRITGELINSIESCPEGSLSVCMRLEVGEICPVKNRVKL
ncbi:MAG: hypothetical protein V3R86_00615 [Candidatus Hydrothermarchaeaceae archaeon]